MGLELHACRSHLQWTLFPSDGMASQILVWSIVWGPTGGGPQNPPPKASVEGPTYDPAVAKATDSATTDHPDGARTCAPPPSWETAKRHGGLTWPGARL